MFLLRLNLEYKVTFFMNQVSQGFPIVQLILNIIEGYYEFIF